MKNLKTIMLIAFMIALFIVIGIAAEQSGISCRPDFVPYGMQIDPSGR